MEPTTQLDAMTERAQEGLRVFAAAAVALEAAIDVKHTSERELFELTGESFEHCPRFWELSKQTGVNALGDALEGIHDWLDRVICPESDDDRFKIYTNMRENPAELMNTVCRAPRERRGQAFVAALLAGAPRPFRGDDELFY